MTNDLFEYKGYFGSVQYSAEDECLYGKIEFIEDLILYDGEGIPSLKKAFQNVVDDYLDMCAERGVVPNTTCKGSFNVRIGQKLHHELVLEARRNQITLNEFIRQTLHDRLHSNAEAVVALLNESMSQGEVSVVNRAAWTAPSEIASFAYEEFVEETSSEVVHRTSTTRAAWQPTKH